MEQNTDTSWREEIPFALITQEQVDSNLQCSICLEDFTFRENVRRLGCAHVFHDQCISPWLNRNNVCPTCRRISINRPQMNIVEDDIDFDNSNDSVDWSVEISSTDEFSEDDEYDCILEASAGTDSSMDIFESDSSSSEDIGDNVLENTEDTQAEFMDDDDDDEDELGDVLEDIFQDGESAICESEDGMFDFSDPLEEEYENSEYEELLDEL